MYYCCSSSKITFFHTTQSRIILYQTIYVKTVIFFGRKRFHGCTFPPGISADFHNPPLMETHARQSHHPRNSLRLHAIYFTHTLIILCCYLFCQTRISRDFHCKASHIKIYTMSVIYRSYFHFRAC